MSRAKFWLPIVLSTLAAALLLTVILVVRSSTQESVLLVRAVGTYQAVDDNLVDSMEPILTLEENGVYAYYPAGGETFYHSGWYTVDDRVITLEDTQGNLRTAIYVNGTIYLVEGDGVVSVGHRMRQNAEYENISIDTLPSPRT